MNEIDLLVKTIELSTSSYIEALQKQDTHLVSCAPCRGRENCQTYSPLQAAKREAYTTLIRATTRQREMEDTMRRRVKTHVEMSSLSRLTIAGKRSQARIQATTAQLVHRDTLL